MASVIVIFGGKEEKTYQLDRSRLVVGREPKCEIQIDNLGISREHCAFSQRGEAFLIQDLNSSNGTYVNGKKITEHFLNNDDEIIVGKYKLVFKNDQQQPAKEHQAPEQSAPVPDTLNTYVMDGPKIQQQLDKMRQAKGGGEIDPVPPKGAVGVTARDYARAMDVGVDKPVEKKGNAGKIVIVLLALFFIFLLMCAAGVAIYLFVLKK